VTIMNTAEAIVQALIAHGLDTIYTLPGVHNDPFFDALFKAANRIRTVHPGQSATIRPPLSAPLAQSIRQIRAVPSPHAVSTRRPSGLNVAAITS
jgi:acetolactate synthase-1/2/3 large subunit